MTVEEVARAIAQVPSDRVFTDGMNLTFEQRIRASAQKRYGQNGQWFVRLAQGPSGKPYVSRRIGIEGASGECVAIGHTDRRGYVKWRDGFVKSEG